MPLPVIQSKWKMWSSTWPRPLVLHFSYQRPPAGAHLRQPHELGACTVHYTQNFLREEYSLSANKDEPIYPTGWLGRFEL